MCEFVLLYKSKSRNSIPFLISPFLFLLWSKKVACLTESGIKENQRNKYYLIIPVPEKSVCACDYVGHSDLEGGNSAPVCPQNSLHVLKLFCSNCQGDQVNCLRIIN